MELEVYDSFSSRGTLSTQRDSMRSPSEVINNSNIFRPEPEIIEERLEEITEVSVDSENYESLYGRDISEEDIKNMMDRPRVKVLTPREVEKIVLREKLGKMTDVERDVEGRFGMI
jgi:uncharacterized membrane protein YkoI